MKTFKLSLFLISSIIISCNSGEDSKIKELESKLEKQQEEINQAKENQLKKEIEEQQKEIEELKNKNSKANTTTANQTSYFAQGKGSFPEGSERILTDVDVRYLGLRDLKIMRNEIFARHGYIFKTADMINHFSGEDRKSVV